MAVTNRSSNVIANATATPRVLNSPAIGGPSPLIETAGLVTPAADDSAGSVHRFVRVPSNARISELLFSTADAATAGALNMGVYETEENGGAVVDADLFASALDLSGGPYKNLDLTQESDEYTFAEGVKPLWEVLGLTQDPCKEYDIAATVSANYNGAGTAQLLKARYTR